MKVLSHEKNTFTIQLTRDELGIIHNSMNEVLNGIEVPEFSTRLGVEVSEVEALLKETHKLLI